MQLKNIYF